MKTYGYPNGFAVKVITQRKIHGKKEFLTIRIIFWLSESAF